MAYEFLDKIFGETKEGEAPRAMTLEELKKAIGEATDLNLVNLKDGGYVSKEKFDSKVTEFNGIKSQLDEANKEIQSFKDMDIEGIKKKTEDWERKYNEDTNALNDKIAAMERTHQEERFFDGYKFSSIPAKKGIMEEFRKKEFKLEEGKFLGAEDFMKGLMENEDYKGAFVIEQPADPQPEQPPKPFFSKGTGSGNGGEPNTSTFGFNFAGVRKH